MEKIKKEVLNKIKTIDQFDQKLLINFISKIKSSEKEAIEEAKEDYSLLMKDLKTGVVVVNRIYKLLIDWKFNYNNSLKSEYYFVKGFSNRMVFNRFKGDEYERFAKVAFDFFLNYKKNTFYDIEAFITDLCKEVKTCIKAESLYNLANNFIYLVNKDIGGSLKLPLIENFELESFKILDKEINDLKSEKDRINDYYDNRLEELRNENIDLDNKVFELEGVLSKKDSRILRLETEVDVYKDEASYKENYIQQLLNEISKRDFSPVSQFNELYWGDNYPSLKVLFDFLQKNNVVQENWSYFASQMSLQNLEPINLNTGILGKKEIGYLLEKIKPFFLLEYKNRKNRYLNVLKRKFYIDFEPIDLNFQKNYIRDYKKAKDWLKIMYEIDNLCSTIADRYK